MIPVSICMSTWNRPEMLRNTLCSIFSQCVPFPIEVIVANDGDPLPAAFIEQFPPQVTWVQIDRAEGRRNPAAARNVAYRWAHGDVIIAQSDDVMHVSLHTIEHLVDSLSPRTFVIASVFDLDAGGDVVGRRGAKHRSPDRPFFFLGALWRNDLCEVGGNDEEFVSPGYEDRWFARCLMDGLGLTPRYDPRIIGWHQYHPPVEGIYVHASLYRRKLRHAMKTGDWRASGGSWPYRRGVPVNELSTIPDHSLLEQS